MLRLSLTALLLLLAACAPRRIPGTEIQDNTDTRAILQVMERFRSALEARDAEAIRALLAESFHDDLGTDAPDDDLTYANAAEQLPQRLAKLNDVKVDFNVRRIAVEGSTATAVYFWNANYRMPKLNTKLQRDSELEQMVFQKVGQEWKIVSGI